MAPKERRRVSAKAVTPHTEVIGRYTSMIFAYTGLSVLDRIVDGCETNSVESPLSRLVLI